MSHDVNPCEGSVHFRLVSGCSVLLLAQVVNTPHIARKNVFIFKVGTTNIGVSVRV